MDLRPKETEIEAMTERIRQIPGGHGMIYVAWDLRNTGRVRESLAETERAHELDALNIMSLNLVALARMAAGHPERAVPVYEDLVARMPDMSFPMSSLLPAHAFLEDWAAVDRLLELAEQRSLREFEEGLAFIRAKRDPTPENIAGIRDALEAHVARTGCVDVAKIVYAAHLGLAEEAYRAAEAARIGPAGSSDDSVGPDAYRPAMFFNAGMPELRSDPRFPRLCARFGLIDFWTATGKWPDCAGEVPYDFRAECERVRDVPTEAFGF
jgi:hypothetical protein